VLCLAWNGAGQIAHPTPPIGFDAVDYLCGPLQSPLQASVMTQATAIAANAMILQISNMI